MKKILRKIKWTLQRLLGIDTNKRLFNQYTYILLANAERDRLMKPIQQQDPKRLEPYGYKSFSQNDEDGIIHEIFRRLGISKGRFIEVGVGDGLENNTYNLLLQGWQGVWLEGSHHNAERINALFSKHLASKALTLKESFVTQDNIQKLLSEVGAQQDIDLFSLDIDGNDYHVLKEVLSLIKPKVIVQEYNAKFAPDIHWVMPYNSDHYWDGSDCFGASLLAFTELLDLHEYQLVSTNITGSNAFYVRKDLAGELFPKPNIETLFNPARYHLTLSFVVGHPCSKAL